MDVVFSFKSQLVKNGLGELLGDDGFQTDASVVVTSRFSTPAYPKFLSLTLIARCA